jgi:hypothetical protein
MEGLSGTSRPLFHSLHPISESGPFSGGQMDVPATLVSCFWACYRHVSSQMKLRGIAAAYGITAWAWLE